MQITTSSRAHPRTITNAQRIYASPSYALDRKAVKETLDQFVAAGGLTIRDERLMEYLYAFNVLSLDQVHRLLWGPVKENTVYRRLNELVKKYIVAQVRTMRAEMRRWGLPPGLVYSLGLAGQIWLEDQVSESYRPRRLKRQQIMHDLLVAEFCLRLTEAVLARGESWEITVSGEQAASVWPRGADAPLIAPDGLVTICKWLPEGKRASLPLFIELDASREAHGRPSSDWGRKIAGYSDLYTKSWRNHPPLRDLPEYPWVAVVTHGGQRLLNLAESIVDKHSQPVIYYLAEWDDLLRSDDLLSAPIWLVVDPEGQVAGWERSDRHPLIREA